MSYECSPVGGGCGGDFASLDGFDSHLIARDYPHSAECREPAWLRSNGYRVNKFGEWYHVERAAAAAARFQKADSAVRESPGADSEADSLAEAESA